MEFPWIRDKRLRQQVFGLKKLACSFSGAEANVEKPRKCPCHPSALFCILRVDPAKPAHGRQIRICFASFKGG